VKFRYFTGYFLHSEDNSPTLIISKWETHLLPRYVMPAVEASKTRVCRANVNDVFGFNGGKEMLSDGWLLNDDHNQILLLVTEKALKFYKPRHVREEYRLKIVPLDLRNKSDGHDEDLEEAVEEETLPSQHYHSCSHTEIAPLTQENPKYRLQGETGELFRNGKDCFLYRTESVAVEYLGFRIEVYSASSPNEVLGIGYALPSTLQDSYGKTSAPLLNKKTGMPVGKIYLGYLFCRPLPLPYRPQQMTVSYGKHWKKRNTPFEVGHRGMGNSYTKFAAARENTLHSLNSAAKNGADYVEFDVHLTSDKVPIVFHDFHVLVSVAKRSPSINETMIKPDFEGIRRKKSLDMHQLAVKDLKLDQLRLLHLDHVKHETEATDDNANNIHRRVTADFDEAEEHLPFPTLRDALNNVSEEVGFNIEIKYPMVLLNGENECENYFERNQFLDIILADVISHASNRRIVFSSFDPDICTMLTLKQNKYPVLFLCVGDTIRHMPYNDPRSSTSMTAVNFAAGVGLMGVNFNSEDVLKCAEPIAKARQFGLISFIWGDELTEKENVAYFKSLGVDGLIYDRIGENETRSNVFLLERQMKKAMFAPASPKNPRTSSISHLLDPPRTLPSIASDDSSLTDAVVWPQLKGARRHLSSLGHLPANPFHNAITTTNEI
jgi:glycerophosphocholine phosphodiesterase GPCPD1